jgi:hypothetical protein
MGSNTNKLVMDLVDTVYPPHTLDDTIRAYVTKALIEEDLKGVTSKAAAYMPKGSRCTLLMPQAGGHRLPPPAPPPPLPLPQPRCVLTPLRLGPQASRCAAPGRSGTSGRAWAMCRTTSSSQMPRWRATPSCTPA